jgi:photosystem II stability/assembly factor-like uncharacterized protein
MIRISRITLCLSLSIMALVAQEAKAPVALDARIEPVKFESETISGLGVRNIGPAVMAGRISTLDGVHDKGRTTLFVGAASGGVWKSVNGGTTFKPVFDKYNQSIGAIRIDPKDPKTVWVGTGETWVRNSVSAGNGLYKTSDAGENWALMGLPDSERIAGIEIDPTDSNIVYVAAMGHLWNSNNERGLYKTSDGGKTWKRILFINDDTGCASLAIDPKDPKTIYASMWQYRRKPWAFESGGPGSGLFKSTNGGTTWTKLTEGTTHGLPAGDLGRIALAISPSNPKVIYANVEAKESALFRSDDGGETWIRGHSGANTIIRPFYFGSLFVDPKDPMRVYKPGLNMTVSDDGGKTFSVIGGSAHGDWHATWIDPENPERIYAGTDGGLYGTEDRGANWRFMRNLPIGQFYHVAVDMALPYRVFGGLQDNSSWMGPSRTGGSIQNRHWKNLYGGDGFWVQPDPTDPNYVYAESQGGYAGRVNLTLGESRFIQPQPGAGEAKLRWNWNTPLQLSPTDKTTLYMGAQYLFRSHDHGQTWERLGGDLTTNDPTKQQQEESGGLTVDNSSAETHCTIYTISESPRNAKTIWVGTDDGNVQLSRNGGKAWTNVVANIAGLPKNTWVSWIEASAFDEGTAFVTFDGHGTGDMSPHVYKTSDFGKSWVSLSTQELKGFAHVVKQDPVNPALLYLGTEAGLFISLDGGGQWAAFKGGDFPPVPVRDIAIHPREKDVVLATHGRGLWIIDDITPLRMLTPEILSTNATFLPSRPSTFNELGNDGWADGDGEYDGRGPRDGAAIAYYQKKRHIFGDLKFEIFDAAGNLVDTLAGDKRKGLNRLYWGMRMKAPKVPTGASIAGGAFFGPQVLEGTYTVKMTKGKDTFSANLQILPDPLSLHTRQEREAQFIAAMDLYHVLESMTYTVDRIVDLRDQSKTLATKTPDESLKKHLLAFSSTLETLRNKYVPVKESGGITGEERLREFVSLLYGAITGYPGKPSTAQLERKEALKKDIALADHQVESYLQKELPGLNQGLASQQQSLKPLSREDWQKAQKK